MLIYPEDEFIKNLLSSLSREMARDKGEVELGNLVMADEPIISETKCHARVRHSRVYLEHLLHLTKVEFAIIFLVLFDVLIVMSQLVIELYACKTKLSHEYHERLETAAKVLHFLSLSFICIFVVEIFLKIFALGGRFFKSKLNIADAFVILTSLVLDVVFIEEEAIQGLGAAITALRVWRIFRIITSVAVAVKAEEGMEREKQAKEMEELKEKIQDLETTIARLEQGGSQTLGSGIVT